MQEERLPLWLRPYEVLVTSDRTALIEFVPNTASIHAIKSKSPPGSSLRDHYLARFGPAVCDLPPPPPPPPLPRQPPHPHPQHVCRGLQCLGCIHSL